MALRAAGRLVAETIRRRILPGSPSKEDRRKNGVKEKQQARHQERFDQLGRMVAGEGNRGTLPLLSSRGADPYRR